VLLQGDCRSLKAQHFPSGSVHRDIGAAPLQGVLCRAGHKKANYQSAVCFHDIKMHNIHMSLQEHTCCASWCSCEWCPCARLPVIFHSLLLAASIWTCVSGVCGFGWQKSGMSVQFPECIWALRFCSMPLCRLYESRRARLDAQKCANLSRPGGLLWFRHCVLHKNRVDRHGLSSPLRACKSEIQLVENVAYLRDVSGRRRQAGDLGSEKQPSVRWMRAKASM
jgi:hypothetical protein